jgi:hypothetical protein
MTTKQSKPKVFEILRVSRKKRAGLIMQMFIEERQRTYPQREISWAWLNSLLIKKGIQL